MEKVNHPEHYQGANECVDVMLAMFGVEAVKGFCKCNAYKYRFRAHMKNGEEDIKKAEWYETKLMELEGMKPAEKAVVKEVKRTAKVGEYIKILDTCSGAGYDTGDIVKVNQYSPEENGIQEAVWGVIVTGVNRGKYTGCIFTEEYVVLEGYKGE